MTRCSLLILITYPPEEVRYTSDHEISIYDDNIAGEDDGGVEILTRIVTVFSKTVKNRRKAEKKRKRLEKRPSESSQDDSGIASSFEDSSPWQLGGGVIIINVIDTLLTFQARVTSTWGQREALKKML